MMKAIQSQLGDHQVRPPLGARAHLSNEYPGHTDRLLAHTSRIQAGLRRRPAASSTKRPTAGKSVQ